MPADLTLDLERLTKIKGAFESTKVYIANRQAAQQAAIDAALALGATEAQLQPLRDDLALAGSLADEVATAISTNP